MTGIYYAQAGGLEVSKHGVHRSRQSSAYRYSLASFEKIPTNLRTFEKQDVVYP